MNSMHLTKENDLLGHTQPIRSIGAKLGSNSKPRHARNTTNTLGIKVFLETENPPHNSFADTPKDISPDKFN